MNYYDEYTGFIEIYLLDEQNIRRYGVKLWDCFAKSVNAQNLDYSTINEQMKLDVSFSYHYWTNLGTEASLVQPLNDRITQFVQNTATRRLTAAIPAVNQLIR